MLDGSNKPTITADRMSAAKPAIAFSGFGQPFHSVIARMAGEVSPLALGQASTDWAEHLWMSPDKQAELARDAAVNERRPIQALHPTVAIVRFRYWCGASGTGRQDTRRQRGVSGH
jgi:hypothetical protein